MRVNIVQPEKIAVAAAKAGLLKGRETRVTVGCIGVDVLQFRDVETEVRFCYCDIHGASDIRQSNIPRDVEVIISGKERFLNICELREGVYVQAAGVELLWQGNKLICDFTDAVITNEDEEPEKTDLPAPLPEPRAEETLSPEYTELAPVRARR